MFVTSCTFVGSGCPNLAPCANVLTRRSKSSDSIASSTRLDSSSASKVIGEANCLSTYFARIKSVLISLLMIRKLSIKNIFILRFIIFCASYIEADESGLSLGLRFSSRISFIAVFPNEAERMSKEGGIRSKEID